MGYRDQRATCPRCHRDLIAIDSRYGCERCKGLLVPADEVQGMLHAMSPDDLRSLDVRIVDGGRPAELVDCACPICSATMSKHELEGVAIDRCVKHGIWFDGKELAAVLEHDGNAYAARQRESRVAPFLPRAIGMLRMLRDWWERPERPIDL